MDICMYWYRWMNWIWRGGVEGAGLKVVDYRRHRWIGCWASRGRRCCGPSRNRRRWRGICPRGARRRWTATPRPCPTPTPTCNPAGCPGPILISRPLSLSHTHTNKRKWIKVQINQINAHFSIKSQSNPGSGSGSGSGSGFAAVPMVNSFTLRGGIGTGIVHSGGHVLE